MPEINEIMTDLAGILADFNGKEYYDPIGPDTLFMAELGFSSIDVVILGETLESHYQTDISFGDFIASMTEQNVQDVPVGALADYLSKTL
ncbi:MAG: phosphopantetheine-binding protein [Verrucomicrobiales bacterium]|nr:phosphopantetheine-binding protein [Verrucomicrobiales bacterium]